PVLLRGATASQPRHVGGLSAQEGLHSRSSPDVQARRTVIELILALAVAIPAWYGYKRSADHGLIVINHVTTFSFGFLLYWVTPILVGVFGSQFAFRVSEVYFGMFDKR